MMVDRLILSPGKHFLKKRPFGSPSPFAERGSGGEVKTKRSTGLGMAEWTFRRNFVVILVSCTVGLASGCVVQPATPAPSIAPTLEPTSTPLPPTTAPAANTPMP